MAAPVVGLMWVSSSARDEQIVIRHEQRRRAHGAQIKPEDYRADAGDPRVRDLPAVTG